MSPPQRKTVAQIYAELGIHVASLYNWRKAWWLQGQVVPASQKDQEGWCPADKFAVVLEIAGMNTTIRVIIAESPVSPRVHPLCGWRCRRRKPR